ncbi:hypothetical protein Tco_0846960 [Tanacetum coccineum]
MGTFIQNSCAEDAEKKLRYTKRHLHTPSTKTLTPKTFDNGKDDSGKDLYLTKNDRESQLYDEFERFSFKDGDGDGDTQFQ